MKITYILLFSLIALQITANPHPIQFSISAHKVVKSVPNKDKDFAFIVPGDLRTYIYTDEAEYYKDYQRSYFAITRAKGGWDCMRHYEILANACIPYFVDIDQCDQRNMIFLPKELIKEAMNLEGVSYGKIDHSKFNTVKYYALLEKLIEHTRQYLTTQKMAQYLLETMNYQGGSILFLTYTNAPDYLPDSLLAGLKELLGEKLIDIPKIEYLYKTYQMDTKQLYGKGFTYSKIISDDATDRAHIEERIANKEFELIIYGSVHRGLLYHDLVKKVYPTEKVFYVCGEDCHNCQYRNLPNLFLREFATYSPYRG